MEKTKFTTFSDDLRHDLKHIKVIFIVFGRFAEFLDDAAFLDKILRFYMIYNIWYTTKYDIQHSRKDFSEKIRRFATL